MEEQEELQYGTHPTLCPDGKYRWAYEVNLFKNPSILLDLLMVMNLCLGILYIVMLAGLINSGFFEWEALKSITLTFFWIALFMFALSLTAYLIWARGSGGRYSAMFTMDEHSIILEEMPKQVSRAEVIRNIGVIIGTVADDTGTTGASLLATSINTWKSDYKSVRKVRMVRRRNLIKVNELLTKNRIYAEDEDLDFVYDFIRRHCPRLG